MSAEVNADRNRLNVNNLDERCRARLLGRRILYVAQMLIKSGLSSNRNPEDAPCVMYLKLRTVGGVSPFRFSMPLDLENLTYANLQMRTLGFA